MLQFLIIIVPIVIAVFATIKKPYSGDASLKFFKRFSWTFIPIFALTMLNIAFMIYKEGLDNREKARISSEFANKLTNSLDSTVKTRDSLFSKKLEQLGYKFDSARNILIKTTPRTEKKVNAKLVFAKYPLVEKIDESDQIRMTAFLTISGRGYVSNIIDKAVVFAARGGKIDQFFILPRSLNHFTTVSISDTISRRFTIKRPNREFDTTFVYFTARYSNEDGPQKPISELFYISFKSGIVGVADSDMVKNYMPQIIRKMK